MDKPSERVRPILKVERQVPDPSANDDSRTALQAAARNYKLVKNQWCDCEEPHDSVYFRSPRTGYRGWISSLSARHGDTAPWLQRQFRLIASQNERIPCGRQAR